MKRKILSTLFALVLVLSLGLVTAVPALAATTYYVATTGNNSNDGSAGNPWLTIQYAVNFVSADDTISVAAGEYNEQVVIGKSLTLQGVGDTTIVKPSLDKLTTVLDGLFWYGGTKNIAGIIVANVPGGSVTIENLKVDESSVAAKPAGADYLAGIFYRETGGTVDRVSIVGGGAWSSGDRAYGMYLSAGTNTVSVEVKDSTITNFDKEGINAEGNKLTVNIHHNTITGRGPISDEVQNGVDIGRDAAGTVSYNTISNLEYGPKTWWAAGIMFYSYVSPTGKSATAIGNTITNCQIGIMFKNVNGSAQGNTVSGGTVGLCGIGAEPNASGATTASFVNNTVSGISGTGHYAIGANTYISVSPGATLTATIDGNQLTGGGSTDADGIIIGDSAGTVATVAATITNNTISGWKSGICLKAVSANAASSSAHNNNIINNQTYGVSNAGTGSLNAEYNWWGTAVDSEIAAMVSGSVDYTPFLTTAPSSVCMTANGQEATPPAVATSDASAIAFTLATLNGDLTAVGSSVGGPQVSFVYGTTSVPSPTGEHGGYSNETAQSQKGTTGAFNANLTTLTAGLTYYFRAKAQPSDMIDPVYGNEKSFTTAKITTLAATSVGVTTATLNGHLDIGSATSVDVYLAYDTTSHSGSPTAYTWNAAVPATLTASGDFSKNVTGLTANTPYYFMAKGAVGADLNYGAEKDFTTLHRIGISVSPTTINFGDIVAGHSSASQTVTVTNTGTPKEKFTTTLANQSPADFYTSNLKIDTTYTAATWSATSVAVGGTATPGLVLSIPIGTAAGAKTGTLIFWAELVP